MVTKTDTAGGEAEFYLWEILHQSQAFRMIGRCPIGVALAWLSGMEDGGLPRLPTHIVIDNLSTVIKHPLSGALLLTSYVCRLRDLERQDQGLPRYWARLADRQEQVLAGDRPEEPWEEEDGNIGDDDVLEPPWGPPPWEVEP